MVPGAQIKNARGRNTFLKKDEFDHAYVGFQVPMDYAHGDTGSAMYTVAGI